MLSQTILLPITSLAHDGRGIGFLPASHGQRGMAVFVAGALPGQTVRCRIFRGAKNYLTARLLEITASDFAPEKPLCPHDQCGGCPLSPLPYAAQLHWKEKLVRDALQRVGKMPDELIRAAFKATSPSGQLRHFRNKITLAFGRDGQGQFSLGFRQRASHLVTAVPHCALVAPAALSIAAAIAAAVRNSIAEGRTRPEFWKFLILRQGCNETGLSGWRALLLTRPADRRARKEVAKMAARLLADAPGLYAVIQQTHCGAELLARGDRTVFALGKDDKPQIMAMPLGGRFFRLPVSSFFQVNNSGAEALAEAVMRMAARTCGPLLDLYCGVGAPGQLLRASHRFALGIELDAAAIDWARRNALDAGLGHWRYESGDVADMLKKAAKMSFGTVLMDPPRSGVHALEAVLALNPGHIIYISCNAATWGRDAARLKTKYSLESIELVDMFPHTPHGEICSLWRRRSN